MGSKFMQTYSINVFLFYQCSPCHGPFAIWEIYLIEKLSLKGIRGHQYMLIAIDYFKKMHGGNSYAKITFKHVAKFIINNIRCRHGVLCILISDHGSHYRKEVEGLHESPCPLFLACNVKDVKSSPISRLLIDLK